MFAGLANMMGGQAGKMEAMLGKFEEVVEVVKQINTQFKDPERTTFICVCIPEFLSLFETERLVQELTKFEIDTHCIVVNQVSQCLDTSAFIGKLFPYMFATVQQSSNVVIMNLNLQVLFADRGSACPKFAARRKLQGRYLEQIYDLYDTFNIVEMPLMDNEVPLSFGCRRSLHFNVWRCFIFSIALLADDDR